MFSYQVRFLFSFVVRRSQPYSLDLPVGDSFAFGDSTHTSVGRLFRRAVVAGGPYSQFVSGCPRSCCCSGWNVYVQLSGLAWETCPCW